VLDDEFMSILDTGRMFMSPTGYLPCPRHVLEPEVPWENIPAYLRAVEDYRFH
jgi:hypothetical protein